MQLSDDFALLWLASGQDFQNTMCPAVPYFLNFESNVHLLSNSSPAKTWLSTGKLSLPHRSTIQRASISITQNRGKYGVIQNRGKCGVIHTNFSNELASHSPDTFLLYANKLDSMASSLESLMAH